MRTVEINEAEAIIEPFWDGGTSDYEETQPRYRTMDEYHFKISRDAVVNVQQGWAFMEIRLESNLGQGMFFSMERNCREDISRYDTMLLFAAIPQVISVDLDAEIDGCWRNLGEGVRGKGDFFEFGFELSGSAMTGLRIGFSGQEEGAIIRLHWIGLSHSGRLQEMLRKSSPYFREWPGFFRDPAETVIRPDIGILLEEAGAEEVRERVEQDPYKEAFLKKKEKALQDMKTEPEALIGRFVPYDDPRWQRTRDKRISMPDIMENLAFVALVEQDYDMMRMACRYAIAAAHCDYWCESVMGAFPGATWHHRSFTENKFCRACALVLDWGGSLLTWHGKQVIQDAIVMKGLPRLESDFRRMEYIHHINQGIVFSEGRILAYLALIPRYPRYEADLVRAENEVREMISNYIGEDGGTMEGPHYWAFTFYECMTALYAIVRKRGEDLSFYRDLFGSTGDFTLSLMSLCGEGTQILPINDSSVCEYLPSSLAGCFYEISQDERWGDIYRKLMDKGQVDDRTFSLIFKPSLKEKCGGQKSMTSGLFPVSGHLDSRRQGKDLYTRVHLCTGKACGSHYHHDKGSIIIEADGYSLCPDCGVGSYYESDLFSLSLAMSHNLLLPVYADHRLVGQDYHNEGGVVTKAIADARELLFTTDLSGAWDKGAFRKAERTVYSPIPEVIILADTYQLDQAEKVKFLMNCPADYKLEGQCARAQLHDIILTIKPLNWVWDKAAVREFRDGKHREIWKLELETGKREGTLATAVMLQHNSAVRCQIEGETICICQGEERIDIPLAGVI